MVLNKRPEIIANILSLFYLQFDEKRGCLAASAQLQGGINTNGLCRPVTPLSFIKSLTETLPNSSRFFLHYHNTSLASSTADLSLVPLLINMTRSSESLSTDGFLLSSFSLGLLSPAQSLIEYLCACISEIKLLHLYHSINAV